MNDLARMGTATASGSRRRSADTRVLLVDDEPAILELLMAGLAGEFDITAAATVTAARATLATASFDVVIADVRLPDGKGLDLHRDLSGRNASARLVLMTGEPRLEDAIRAVECGAFRYLRKPLRLMEVRSVIAAAADRARVEPGILDDDLAWTKDVRVAWQPIVDASTGRPVGYEALARFGRQAPGSVEQSWRIIAERGRAGEVGNAVRRQAALDTDRMPDHASVFLNVDPSELADPGLVEAAHILGLPPRRIVLEITEQGSLYDHADWQRSIARLRRAGYRVALDDFGAGHNGLLLLSTLPPDFVKLDRALVQAGEASARVRDALRAVARLCNDFGCTLLAEGIETRAQERMAIQLGCGLLQGYRFGAPMEWRR